MYIKYSIIEKSLFYKKQEGSEPVLHSGTLS